MTHLLHLDASARPGRAGEHPHGSLTRALSHRFVARWTRARPQDAVSYRDVGLQPPPALSGEWIHAAFTPEANRSPAQRTVLAHSDALVNELLRADLLVLGVPMYNFGPPAAFKAWLDHIVRIGRTFDFDPARGDDPYVPLLADRPRQAVLLSSRGGHGFDDGGAMAAMNHLDPAVRTVLGFIGITEVHGIAIEHEEHGGERLARSVALAHARIDALVDRWLAPAPAVHRAAGMQKAALAA
ncbi:FMN-dependent NADH-azoreductase [Xenophilus azovorans]|uniref:FMN-dependent NADH-azoreductase n=1 Tax=Xenophilus azovorans TaxID=151755 RepID=UPI000571C657|nr:NAD(P)H-dependent oxidoreductase [Xenophilus azovorans]